MTTDYLTPALILALGGFYAFLLWRVRVEEGRVAVELTPLQRAYRDLARAIQEANQKIGDALLPPIRAAIHALADFYEAFVRAVPDFDPDFGEGDTDTDEDRAFAAKLAKQEADERARG